MTNSGPWGKTPNNGSQRPSGNDLDDLFKKSQDSFKSFFDGGDNKRTIFLSVIAFVLIWFASGVYRVNSDELGVVLRFGEFHRITSPGLNYHLPYPFERVFTPSVTTINKVEVGYRSNIPSNSNFSRNAFGRESQMLTGDRNIVDIGFEVQWKIDETRPQDFMFNMRNPAGTVKPVAESAMREVVGTYGLEDILASAQTEIADETQSIMQEMLNSYNAGIEITSVNLSKPDVPTPVIDAFQDVKKAEQDKETAIQRAEGYRNDIIPKARGQAVEMEQQALAYKEKVIAGAQGDVSRFLSVYNEYKEAKDVTKTRIYLETMESMLQGMEKIIIDGQAVGGSGVLPYLPLEQLKNKR